MLMSKQSGSRQARKNNFDFLTRKLTCARVCRPKCASLFWLSMGNFFFLLQEALTTFSLNALERCKKSTLWESNLGLEGNLNLGRTRNGAECADFCSRNSLV